LGLLEKKSTLLKMDVLKEDSDDARIIQGIKKLLS